MREKNQWKEFFDGHAPDYMSNCFTKNTLKEVDFIIDILKLEKGSTILDTGCGTGRHSIELAVRGYNVTGIDLSSGMLREARKGADKAGVNVKFIEGDARNFDLKETFDGAICICEGAFGLLGKNDDPVERDLDILKNINRHMRKGAILLLTALSAYRMARAFTEEDVEKGKFDPHNLVENTLMEWDGPEGKKYVHVRERSFVPTELSLMLKIAGFEVKHIWGGTAGKWGKRRLELDEYEIMVVGKKL